MPGQAKRAREGTAGVSYIQRGRPAPAHRHFGSATPRTRKPDATTDLANPKDRSQGDPRADRLTTEGSRYDAGSRSAHREHESALLGTTGAISRHQRGSLA